MAKFRSRGNPSVVIEFTSMVDILTTRAHPDYDEVTEKGEVIGTPKTDKRPEWDIPMHPIKETAAKTKRK